MYVYVILGGGANLAGRTAFLLINLITRHLNWEVWSYLQCVEGEARKSGKPDHTSLIMRTLRS